MTDADSVRFKTVMANLGIAFGKSIGGPLTTLYWNGLKGITIDLLESAADAIIREDRVFPRVARIRTVIQEAQTERARQGKLLADPNGDADGIYCADCRDTGLKAGVCTTERPCKWCRSGWPEPAAWVVPCHCKFDGSNPNFEAKIQTAKANVQRPDHSYARQSHD